MKHNQATIETIINTSAIALTTFGVTQIMGSKWEGYVAVLFGMGLEFIKYYGRKKKLW